MPDLRIAFAGSPEFAASILTALWSTQFAPVVVLTQPDRPKGRGNKVAISPVKAQAIEHACPVLQPLSLRDATASAELAAFSPDLLIVVAYGLLLPQAVLDLPTYGCLNVHASLLPRWRGAAPVERAIMAGDEQTGVCIMQMDAGLDTGPVHARESIRIAPTATGGELETQLADIGQQQLLAVLEAFAAAHAAGDPPPQPQPQANDGATYASKLTAADRAVDWGCDARDIANQVRALSDRMPVRVRVHNLNLQLISATPIDAREAAPPGTIVAVDQTAITVACGSGALAITNVRIEQGKGTVLSVRQARNGYPDALRAQNQFVALAR